jgi:hypothetical protein
MKKKCLECTEEFTGRSDKKFCSDYCRNSHNNKADSETKKLIRNINNRLKKNHKILSKLNGTCKTKITKSRLIDEGFYFQYFTNIYTTRNGNTYYYIYNQGYLELDNDMYLLIKNKS